MADRLELWCERGFDPESGVNPLAHPQKPPLQHEDGFDSRCGLCCYLRQQAHKSEAVAFGYDLFMCNFNGQLVGFLLGVSGGVLAAQLWEFVTRRRLYRIAQKLDGVWTAHEMLDGRTIDRAKLMENAWPTVMRAKSSGWSAASHILDITAADTSTATGLRPHSSHLVIDRVATWRASRVVFYADSDEAFEQSILISPDWRTLHVLPVPGYNRHALCKVD
jgi:hypothetical protein